MTELLFVILPSNKNSFAALCGALNKAPEISGKLNLKFIEEKEILKNLNPKMCQIICSSFQTPDVFRIQPLISKIKKESPKSVLITGGAHPSGAPEHTLKMGFDFVFVGEGEESLISFLNEYTSSRKNYQKIKGIAFKKNGKIIFTGKANPVDVTKYLPISQKFTLFTPIEITRGCPHGCRFCQTTYLFGKIRHRTIRQIVESAEILVAHDWTKIRFVSPNILSYGSKNGFISNLPELEKMLLAVRKVRGVKKIYTGSFPSEVRPENSTKEALLILKKYSDNDNIIIGFQSGSDNVLKRMHRGHTARQAFEVIENALEVGFKVNVDFIFGNPGETEKEEKETINILKKLAKLPKVKIHGHTFLPLPGTPWQNEKPGKISSQLIETIKELEKSGKIYGDWQKQEKLGKKIASLNHNRSSFFIAQSHLIFNIGIQIRRGVFLS